MTAASFWVPAAVAATGGFYAGVIKPNLWRLPERWRWIGNPVVLWLMLGGCLGAIAYVSDVVGY